ncbi:MAG: hypothetical protein HC890_04140 [Chloroflexaceae bacterium]|nr:hypothetical protein [Chloroflexaceae bacterium]
MSQQPIRSLEEVNSLANSSEDLTEALLAAVLEQETYPWNPAEPEADAYFENAERAFTLFDTLGDPAIEAQAEAFFRAVQQSWQGDETASLQAMLSQRFQGVPAAWLQQIAEQARRLMEINLVEVHKLVACVKPVLTNWGEDDLQILARPLAYAMRGNISYQKADWANLSPVEQARLSLEIAQYALTQLSSQSQQSIDD